MSPFLILFPYAAIGKRLERGLVLRCGTFYRAGKKVSLSLLAQLIFQAFLGPVVILNPLHMFGYAVGMSGIRCYVIYALYSAATG